MSKRTVEDYIASRQNFAEEVARLREILLTTGLDETVKWGMPIYTEGGRNVVGIGAFKSYFGLWFHQGSLIDDPHGVLINAQEGKTEGMRQWRMQSARDIKPRFIRAYVKQAREVAASGAVVKKKAPARRAVPVELRRALKTDPTLAEAFAALSAACRREYAAYVGEAKREDTRLRRVEKVRPMIAAGQGLNDRYRGKSKVR